MARHIPALIVAALLLCPGAASSQVAMGAGRTPGISFSRPDPKPEPAPARPAPDVRPDPRHDPRPAPGEDLFRARPGTYQPRPVSTSRHYYARPFIAEVVPQPPVVIERIVERPVIIERTVIVEKTPEPEATPAPPPAPPIRAARKVYYVIPRCYVGDKPPAPETLRPECDIKTMRVIGAP